MDGRRGGSVRPVEGTNGPDTIYGGAGEDRIGVGGGRGALYGVDGKDFLNPRDGTGGNDANFEGPGVDTFRVDRGTP